MQNILVGTEFEARVSGGSPPVQPCDCQPSQILTHR